jgi:acyl-CoA synthetase (AMP-forming)/AMP-acid ligase II
VTPVPDEQWGETGKAWLVFHPDHIPHLDQVQAFAQQHLAKYKVPRHWAIIDALPLTPSGKTDLKLLKSMP